MSSDYLFTSDRLGFRNWKSTDLDGLYTLCSDPKVMKHFPSELSKEESRAFLQRLRTHFEEHGYTYYAVETLADGHFIGFIGLALQDYKAPFTPCVDIGWRLLPSFWGNGYATEGAARCLKHAQEELGIRKVVAVCSETNIPSERVMQRFGMEKEGNFLHPKLDDFPRLRACVWYELKS